MRRYNLWLAFTAGLRPMRHNELIEEYGSAYDVFLAAARGDIPSKTAADGRMLALMKAKAEEGYIDRCLEYLHNQNISVVLLKDKAEQQLDALRAHSRHRLPKVLGLR